MPTEYFERGALDRGLMEGLTELEASIDETGWPSWLTHGSDALGAFTAKPGMNYARDTLAKARASEKEPPAGREWTLERTTRRGA